jgi:FtsP/CotA-like multicopper oxidase with cupredoxin domain
MNRLVIKRLRDLVLIIILLLTTLTGMSSAATFDLQAGVMMKTMPDGKVVPMWGFGPVAGPITVPGPTLIVPPGDDTLTINLTNNLPVPVSVILPGLPNGTVDGATAVPTWTDNSTGPRVNTGQRVRSLTLETAMGQTRTYSWSIANPGTYLYKSGTHQQVQVQMGLYGPVSKNFAAGQAYSVITSAFVNEISLLFSEIDSALHDKVANGNYNGIPASIPNSIPGTVVTSTIDHQPKYFLINGEPFSYTRSVIPAGNPGENTLLRFLNAGYEDYVPILHGVFVNVLAEDSHLYPFPKKQYSLQLSPGRTMDAIITNPAAGYIPLYDRRLHLTNAASSPGGMLTYLNVAGAMANLTANTAGTGTGTIQVVSLPGGINCSSADPLLDPVGCTEAYNLGTVVSLAAVPASGSEFTGWSGALVGTVSPSRVTMDGDKIVSATFTLLPSITLTSPNGGENLVRGTTQNITWSFTSDPGANVKIQLISTVQRGTRVVQQVRTLARTFPIGNRSFIWRIPNFFRPGNNYKIRITSITNPAFTDMSDSFFSVVP